MGNGRKKCLAFPEGSIGQIFKFILETGKRILTPELRGSRIRGIGRELSGNITTYPVSVCIYVVWHACGLVCMAHGTWGVYGVWCVACIYTVDMLCEHVGGVQGIWTDTKDREC